MDYLQSLVPVKTLTIDKNSNNVEIIPNCWSFDINDVNATILMIL